MRNRKKTKNENQKQTNKTTKTKRRFALAVRQKIVGYYQTGYFTANMLCKKSFHADGISVDLLHKWLRESETIKEKENELSRSQVEKKKYKDKDEEIASLKKELVESKKALRYAELKHKALDILIDIAEKRFGIQIKRLHPQKVGRWR